MIFADFYLAEIQNSVNLKKHNNQCQKIILSLSRQPQRILQDRGPCLEET